MRASWEKNGFHSNIKEKFVHVGCHGSAISWKSAMGENGFHSSIEEKLPYGGRRRNAMS